MGIFSFFIMSRKKGGIIALAVGAVAAIGAAVAAKAIVDEQKSINDRKRKQQNKRELRYDPTKPCSISIMSHHGKFMGFNGSRVHCRSTERGNAETFISIPIPNTDSDDVSVRIALKTFQSKYSRFSLRMDRLSAMGITLEN